MRKGICILLMIAVVVWPNLVLAAECLLNINIMREDGTTYGELVFNNQIIWRLAVLADGARTVTSVNSTKTTFVAPDIANGMFLIKVQ
jgi:hypothetical protein